jgi:hypothetical protein
MLDALEDCLSQLQENKDNSEKINTAYVTGVTSVTSAFTNLAGHIRAKVTDAIEQAKENYQLIDVTPKKRKALNK